MESLTLEQLNYITQLVGAIAVVVSIFYLGAQVRQGSIATRVGMAHELSARITDRQSALAHDGEMADIYVRGLRDFDSLNVVEKNRFSLEVGSILRVYDEQYYIYREGVVDEFIWRGFNAVLEDLLHYAGYKAVWRLRKHHYSETFQTYVDGVIAKTEGEAGCLYPQ